MHAAVARTRFTSQRRAFRKLGVIALAIAACAVSLLSRGADATRRRRERERFEGGLSLGVTFGAGAPLGFAGAFVEYRPFRGFAISGGGGLGGIFGPAIAATVHVDPISTTGWAIGAAGSLSRNYAWFFMPRRIGERGELPETTDWLSLEVQTQFRPHRSWFLRFGFGRAFMLNTPAYRMLSAADAETLGEGIPFLADQIDAVRSAARDQTVAAWFGHMDIGFNFFR